MENARSGGYAPGAAVTAGDNNGLWSVHSGQAALFGKPIQSGDQVRVGSLSKLFTSTMTLQLVAERRVDLDGPVERYLPGVVKGDHDGNKITIRNLLNHTSGIPDFLNTAFDPFKQLKPHTLAEVAGWGLSQKSLGAPGSVHAYSGTGYVLLGMVIEKVTGRSFSAELADRFVRPLGLTGTSLPTPGDKSMDGPQVRGHVGQVLYADVTEVVEPSIGAMSGGMVSTGTDMAKFAQALATGKLLPPHLMAEMRKPNGAPVGDPHYGLGLIRYPLPCGGEAWGHPGIWPGYQTVAAATDDGRTAFVVVNNLSIEDLIAMLGLPQSSSGGSGSGSSGGGNGNRYTALGAALCEPR
ncbi:serine hydrolase domain-containing protein [Herbihabitans rhizosphaerae]|uniref:serine hydrolase domain-containing protein n=1 Tax=Herbihabitans rhizosphaerae TaxID=1872711 RepID=UPI0013EE7A11|nr:serine hydrolase domain-containing protein [Herbihabitans rhizosphaerae]